MQGVLSSAQLLLIDLSENEAMADCHRRAARQLAHELRDTPDVPTMQSVACYFTDILPEECLSFDTRARVRAGLGELETVLATMGGVA